METPDAATLAADLRRYLEHKQTLFSPELSIALADVNTLTASILKQGWATTIAELQSHANVRSAAPFIETCDAIIEHHLRIIKEEKDRELIRKSLFEAYVYLGGAEHVFEPPNEARILSFLKRHGSKGFAALFLSLHLFNVIRQEIEDKVRVIMPDQKFFELYMLGTEAVCRDIVTATLNVPGARLDQQWAAAVCTNIEKQLLLRP